MNRDMSKDLSEWLKLVAISKPDKSSILHVISALLTSAKSSCLPRNSSIVGYWGLDRVCQHPARHSWVLGA
jgi:hypothetical protein